MICALLGAPYEDHDFFQTHTTMGLDRYATAETTRAASLPMAEYMRGLITTKLENPGQDALSDLAARVKLGELTMAEATAAGQVLLTAGHETSANMIALGTLALLEHPDQRAILEQTDDSSLIANAVEELLRYLSIIHNGQRRLATGDIEVGGETIKTGEGIILELASADRDKSIFPDPGRLDLERQEAFQHHGFGHGTHQCLGQQLARVELHVVYRTLFKRMPSLRLATTIEQINFKDDRLAYGVYELPVAW
jgi:cytochrome P450